MKYKYTGDQTVVIVDAQLSDGSTLTAEAGNTYELIVAPDTDLLEKIVKEVKDAVKAPAEAPTPPAN